MSPSQTMTKQQEKVKELITQLEQVSARNEALNLKEYSELLERFKAFVHALND